MESQKQFDNINIPTNKIKQNDIKQNTRNITRTHFKHNKLNNTLEQLTKDFTINETYCKITNNELTNELNID